jgi:regulator of protease activity HflC (stomatin/prohibitin superfamily)
LHFVIPFVDSAHVCFWTFVAHNEYGKYIRFVRVMRKIDLRESVYDFPKQNVITKDNVNIEINALLYYQITDPKAAVYEVSNLPEAIEKLTQTTLRNVIGSMDLDETLVSRDFINGKLQVILDEATDKWGVKINRVELQEVNPPRDIQVAMEKQMRAERDRRAIILESEGEKRAAILKAEGDRESRVLKAQGIAESTILEAEGQAQARLKIIQAEAQALETIQKAIPGKDPLAYMIAQEYIKTLPEILKDATGKTILFPYESSGLMGSLSTIKTLFQETK